MTTQYHELTSFGTWNGSTYANPVTQRFVWDGQVLLAILDGNNNLVQSFVRGLDLSGTFQGAGGAGGLLMVRDASTLGSASTHFVCYDGNGNVMGLVNAADGTVSAQYEYGPFGEPIRVTGPMGKANVIRFSTQFTDDVTDLLYYCYRYYNPTTGRWLSRDPIGERGGVNLYAFLGNDPVVRIDKWGLSELPASQYRTYIESRLNAGVRNIDDLWREALNHYLEHDPETDCVWDCEDDLEEIIEAFYRIFGDLESDLHHGSGVNAGVHTGDGSAVTHFFAGAAFEGAYELGDTAQDVFEKIGGRSSQPGQSGQGGDWLSDTAYAYAGADFSDYFDTWTEKECRKRVKEFTTGTKTFTGLLGPTVPANTRQGVSDFRTAYRERLGK